MTSYVLAYDVGTSSVKTTLVDDQGKIHQVSQKEYPIHYPHPGWAEQDPMDYWNAIIETTRTIAESINKDDIKGLIFTCQAMGVIPISKDGSILHNNITWVDGRAEKQAIKMMNKLGGRKIFRNIIGIEVTGKDVIPKLMWLKQERPDIYNNTETILDVNGFLKFMATGERVFEWSGACSYAFDLKKKDFDRIVFKFMGVDLKKLPSLVRSIDAVGNGLLPDIADKMGLNPGTKVFGGMDDVQSAAMGSTAIDEGEIHVYLGTSAWVCASTKTAPKFKNAIVTLQGADPERNIVVGVTESGGALLEWAVKELYKGLGVSHAQENIFELMDKEISSVDPGSEHLIFTPWVLGERAPISTTTTRGTIFNLGLEHSRAHIVRAIDEGIAYNLRWILQQFKENYGFDPDVIKVVGGGSQSRVWMQILADVLQKPVETLAGDTKKFAGAIGAAMTAFVGLGVYDDFMEIKKILKVEERFEPDSGHFGIYDKLFADYQRIFHDMRNLYTQANARRFTEVMK
ncbi:MAG: FGGY-family carbohydrate kinase [Candidatus Heimdallarchaeota archaeon]|nr:FGGY-family carbohydrate kinase [Candidatus Heimdallarchaeota archaeon]